MSNDPRLQRFTNPLPFEGRGSKKLKGGRTMFFKIHIRRHERGLWFRKGDFHKLLGPGTHYNWGVLWSASRDNVQVVDTLKTRFSHEQLEILARASELRDELLTLDLAD